MLEFNKGAKPNTTNRIKFEQTDSTKCVVENEYCKIYSDTRSGKTFKVINGEVAPIELRELNLWKNRQKNPNGFVVDVIKDDNGMIYDYIISRADSKVTAQTAAPIVPQPTAVHETPAAPVAAQVHQIEKWSETDNAKTNTVTVISKAPNVTRIKFEMTPTTNLVLENEYCKIYSDTRSGKTFKVINDEVAPIELRELNMWKNRQKNSNGFNVEIVKNENGQIYDYVISRTNGSAAAQNNVSDSPLTNSAPKAEPMQTQSVNAATTQPNEKVNPTAADAQNVNAAKPTPAQPAANRPMQTSATAIKPASTQSIMNTQAKTLAVSPNTETVKTKSQTVSRIKFEMTPTTNLVLENEYCKIYSDTRSGKTFKVINDEVAPIELRELNMWKNRQKNPSGFAVEIVKNENGQVYDFVISRAGDSAPMQNSAVKTENTPVAKAAAVQTEKSNNRTASNPKSNGTSPVTTSVGTAPEGRIDFVESETTKPVIETEYGKIYRDSRSGKTFKVIDGKISYIELRELNMWKNRQNNPQGFSVNVVRDTAGKIVDYTIAKINEDGSLTPAPTPAPVMAPTVPDFTPVQNSTAVKSEKNIVRGMSESTTSVTTKTANDRINFEMTPTTKVVVEDEFCTIYNDSRAGRTFKVIGGKVVPIELRELNMWKNKQRNPKNFSVEIVKDENGNDYDFIITRIGKASSAAVETTSVTTNKAPVVDNGSSEVNKKRRPKSGRMSRCAVCGKEYLEDDLFLFGNRNYCFSCVEEIVKERQENGVIDPIQKAIDDVVTADELYCTYSTITNYPYLDEEFCVNVCTVRRAAETVIENTTVQTIDDKGDFFDDLKRFGLKKIIINNDQSHIFSPHDFDEHVKTEGVIAPKLYFKILNFMQRRDDELREGIAASFLASKVFTYALNDDITEITEENLDEFKPLTITDGYVNFCPVFTDYSEAKSVGLPFKGLYEIEAKYIVDSNVTHFIINPSSLGFIMNKTILDGVQPRIESDIVEEVVDAEQVNETAVAESVVDTPNAVTTAEPVKETPKAVPAAEPVKETPKTEEAQGFFKQKIHKPLSITDFAKQQAAQQAQQTKEAAQPVEKAAPKTEQASESFFRNTVIKPDGGAPVIRTQMNPYAGSTASDVIEYSTSLEETVAKEPRDIPQISKPTTAVPSNDAFPKNVHEIMNDLAAENETDDLLDLSNLIIGMPEEPAVPKKKPTYLIQQKITETKAIERDLDIEPDFGVASILRDKLKESYKELAKMIAESKKMYAEFDLHTKHILIDGNNRGHIFSDKSIAEASVENFTQNGIDVYIEEYDSSRLFSLLYEYKRHGIQDLVLDETANWIIISTDSISDVLDVDDKEYISIPITNPELMFSMTTLFQKLQSKSTNPKRKAEIQSLERRMIREFTSARYILPLIAYDENNVRPVTIDSKNGTKRVLVFSDVFEMKRFFGNKLDLVKDYNIMSYRELIREFTVKPNTVVVLNEGSLRFEFNDHNCDHINKIINS